MGDNRKVTMNKIRNTHSPVKSLRSYGAGARRTTNKDAVSIFILLDALGWNYIKDRPFLNDICSYRQKVKTILGYSCGVIPSILTGKLPSEHRKFSLFYYSPDSSPFRWTKYFLWLPDKILESRVSRKIVEIISKNIYRYKGYFETYIVPIKYLHLFNLPEKTNAYDEQAFRCIKSVFDIWKERNIAYKRYYYNVKGEDIFRRTGRDLQQKKYSHYFLYFSEFDHFLHDNCQDKVKVEEQLSWYEERIRSLYSKALENYKEVNLCVFSDHGMVPIERYFDLKQEVLSTGYRVPRDYVAMYDATMARFWFSEPQITRMKGKRPDSQITQISNTEARKKIIELLSKKDYGRILSEDDKRRLGIDFSDSMYGEVIFLMKPGSVINPSFMGNKKVEGMHGFSPDNDWMNASFLSNYDPGIELRDIRDLFRVMTEPQISADLEQISADISGIGHRVWGIGKKNPIRDTRHPTPEKHAIRNTQYAIRKQRIKVIYFLNSMVRAGAEEHVLSLLRNLNRESFEPVLVCPQELIDLMKEDLKKIDVRAYSICIRRWRNLREIKKFIEIVKLERPDIVHPHLFFATRFVAPITKFAKVPVVIETAHLREAWRKGIKRMYAVDRFFYRFVDKIIAVSGAVKNYLINDKKLPAEKISVIHNGVDLKRLQRLKSDYSDEKISLSSNTFKIGVIGRLEPQKGHKYFLEAVSLLDGKFEDVKCLIVGEGSLKEELADSVQRLGISDRVQFLGYRQDIKDIIAGLDLVVLPSLYEGLPLVALEAQAMGKPMVVTNVDGSPEVVIHNKTGIVIPCKDSQALKEAIEVFLNNRDLAIQMGEEARRHIEANFDIRAQIEKTQELYKHLLNTD
ncbi:MAG: glycosyltransferase [Deltaproteobacteria bacterium]|nr:glycosyltransferase [Deltaproteobacteria bacterium]